MKTQGGRRAGAGRKPNAAKGLEVRARSVTAAFTDAELDALDALAEAEGLTVSELIAYTARAALAVAS